VITSVAHGWSRGNTVNTVVMFSDNGSHEPCLLLAIGTCHKTGQYEEKSSASLVHLFLPYRFAPVEAKEKGRDSVGPA
jgi:hypothetical protein